MIYETCLPRMINPAGHDLSHEPVDREMLGELPGNGRTRS